MIFTNESPATAQTAVLSTGQKVVCEFCDNPPTGFPYHGKNLCEECIADIDDSIDRAIDEARMEEHFNDLDYEEM